VRYEFHGSPALYWPLASDPDLFKPAAVRDIDVSFIGNKYGARGRIVSALQQAGIKVEAYGKGWPNGSATSSESAEIFGRSKIVLGIGTIGHSEDMVTLKLRDFDATMAGAMYITHRNPDLLEIFAEGVEIECYSSEKEAVRKIKHYLAHPEACARLGERAASKARGSHTWTQRLESVFSLLGVWGAAVPKSGTGVAHLTVVADS
jgi:spore maturation protein CgeB